MYKKTIKKKIEKKLNEWLESITDNSLREKVRENILLSGGSIASMFLNEKVNDYDIYLMDMDVLFDLAIYYTKGSDIDVLDGRKRNQYLLERYPDIFDGYQSEGYVKLKTLKPNQIKLNTPSEGKRIEYSSEDKLGKYHVKFISPNAISLSDDIQVVCRFNGTPEEIHKTFDFIHATNYFTFKDGLVTNVEALEALLGKQLRYQGSLYPLTSIIRTKKFIKRGWNIGAGEYLKIMFQISGMDLTDPEILEEQLIGVDVAYFGTLIKMLRDDIDLNKDFVLTYDYLSLLIDKVFGEDDISFDEG